MFNNAQNSMLCVTCFKDAPHETRLHCVDIDAAYTQTSKKLDRAVIVCFFFGGGGGVITVAL